MSHIQGQPHPDGTTEQLLYIRVEVTPDGALSQIAVVTSHLIAGLNLPGQAVTYKLNPGPRERDLAPILSATRRTALQGVLTALATAVAMADTPTDPAPPLPPSP